MDKIFTVKIKNQNDEHTIVSIFNRGGKSGELTILTDDVDEFIRRIAGGLVINQTAGVIEKGAKVTGVKIGRLG